MSFQGDVGGIGLADLLQSLARGRSGVLSLHSKDGLRATLGVEDGRLHLLPEPDEDPENWRKLARIAWVDEPETLVDVLRMEEIARARRLEALYCLLDSNTVHFRFAPGPVPKKPEGSAIGASEQGLERRGPGRDSVWCGAMPIEGMLLEYARLKDDWDSLETTWREADNVVLQRLDSGAMKGDVQSLHSACNGTSSLLEISDRLGWPARQTRIIALKELRRGALRFSTPPELLYLVQHELARTETERAVSRLRSWLEVAQGGPLAEVDAQGFQAEWSAGTLQPVVSALPARNGRSFLRRLDHTGATPHAALARWKDFVREKANDRTAQIRLIAWQLRASVDPNIPGVRDLLALSRALLRENKRLAAASILRIAAARSPETAHVRLEIGHAMVQAGIAIEATPFLLDVIRPILDAGRSEEVLPALRSLSEALPENRDIRRMYLKARAHAVQRTLVKKHSIVTFSVLIALSVGAVVQYTSHRQLEKQLGSVMDLVQDPAAALMELEANFPDDASSRVIALRADLEQRKRQIEVAVRTAWTDEYNGAALECTLGDMQLGLRRALALPTAPMIAPGEEPLPLVSDLYNGLAARLDAQVAQLDVAIEDTQAQINAEARVLATLKDLEETIDAKAPAPAREFETRVADLEKKVSARGEARATARTQRVSRENVAHQDVLVNTARAHKTAGDYKRALEVYRELLKTDPTGKLAEILAREIAEVEALVQALADGRQLALDGRQSEAHKRLKDAKIDADGYLLPWTVVTVPPGARATLPDGSKRVTPFTLETTWKESVAFTLELDGYEPRRIVNEHPADVNVTLSRLPERAWSTAGRVEAPPVAVGDDHVVVDRSGGIARLSRRGTAVWESKFSSLGGIARAPVFLPSHPGHLLVVSEDGDVWIVDANTGAVDGPWSAGSPPAAGPLSAPDSVVVQFRDGRTFSWTERLLPTEVDATALKGPVEGNRGSDAGLTVLRRRASSATSFSSPSGMYTLEIGDHLFVLRSNAPPDARPGKPTEAGANASGKPAKPGDAPTTSRSQVIANVRRSGEWTYIAWEAPNVAIPHGRVWISDEAGLRAFTP